MSKINTFQINSVHIYQWFQTHTFILSQYILPFETFLSSWHHKLLETTRGFCKKKANHLQFEKNNHLQFCSICCVVLFVEALLNWFSRMLWQRYWLLWFTFETPYYSIGLYNNSINSISPSYLATQPTFCTFSEICT